MGGRGKEVKQTLSYTIQARQRFTAVDKGYPARKTTGGPVSTDTATRQGEKVDHTAGTGM